MMIQTIPKTLQQVILLMMMMNHNDELALASNYSAAGAKFLKTENSVADDCWTNTWC